MVQSIKRESKGLSVDTKKEEFTTSGTKKVDLPVKQQPTLKQKDPIDWEKQIGQVWLPRVFIFVLLLGVIWAFKAASDYGFINDPIKVLLGYLAGGASLLLGFRQLKQDRNALGQVLIGGSIVLFLIVTFAMHVLFGLVPLSIAFILNVIWVCLGIYLSNKLKSQPLAILTGVGGYLIPFLLESEAPNITNFVLFETFLYLSLLVFAMRKKFNILYHVSFVLLHITLLVGALLLSQGDIKIFALSAIIQHVFLLIALFINQLFIKQQVSILFTSFVITTAWMSAAFTGSQFEMMVLIVFAVYTGLSVYSWKKGRERLSATLSIASISFVIYLISAFEVENILGLLMIQGLISVYLGLRAQSILKQVVGITIYAYSALAVFTTLFDAILSTEFLNWIILLGSMYGFVLMLPSLSWIKENEKKQVTTIIYTVTMALLLVFITQFVRVLTQSSSLNIQYMSVSFAWALYAFAGIILGSLKNNKPLRVFGLILLFLTLGKLIFIDLNFISIFIRSILFIGLGVIGILGSRIFYK